MSSKLLTDNNKLLQVEKGSGVSHCPAGSDEVEKAVFKHLTGAECVVPCLRVISSGPLLCSGVIPLHFTLPVILACCDSLFVQRTDNTVLWLYTMCCCFTRHTEENPGNLWIT